MGSSTRLPMSILIFKSTGRGWTAMNKKCSQCGVYKELSEFYKDARYQYGVVGVCKKCKSKNNREYRCKNHADIIKREKARYVENRATALAAMKKYERAHKEEILSRKKKYNKKRRSENPIYRESMLLRGKTWRVFKRKGAVKSNNFESVVGCTCEDLYLHLLSTWETKYGVPWSGEPCEIDHIKPLCTAKSVDDVKSLFHYSNLQLLTPEDNCKKGCSF